MRQRDSIVHLDRFLDCVCPTGRFPVCGIDGVSYDNRCRAKCNNVVEFRCAKSCDKCDGKHTKLSTRLIIIQLSILYIRHTHHTTNVTKHPECTTCVAGKTGELTCCGNGGSWAGNCGLAGDAKFDHTWDEGVKACSTVTLNPIANKPVATAGGYAWLAAIASASEYIQILHGHGRCSVLHLSCDFCARVRHRRCHLQQQMSCGVQ